MVQAHPKLQQPIQRAELAVLSLEVGAGQIDVVSDHVHGTVAYNLPHDSGGLEEDLRRALWSWSRCQNRL